MRHTLLSKRGLACALTLCAGIGCPWSIAQADPYEAKIYGVTVWDGGTCTGSTRNSWDDMARGWYNEITSSSWYYKKANITNGNIVSYKFSDRSLVSWGDDTPYVDDADAALLFWHGSESGNIYRGSMRLPNPNDNACRLFQDDMELGDSDLEFLVLSSCQSMDDNQ